MRTTVLGATGGIGRAITLELAARGHEVTAASRSVASAAWPTGVTPRPTDLTDPAAARAATHQAEVVVMAAQVPYPRWTRELGPLFDVAADATAAAGARLVVVDNLYAYGSPDAPITEATPERPDTRKGRLRAELGRRLLARHTTGEVSTAIGRFSDYYGPDGGNSLIGALGIDPAVRGRTVRTYLDADQPHTFAYLPDAARAFVRLVEEPRADGRVWILPAAPAITQRALYDLLDDALERPARRGHVTLPMLRTIGLFDRTLREAIEMRGQFTRPWRTDAAAFESAFGPVPLTPHADALAACIAAGRDRLGETADR